MKIPDETIAFLEKQGFLITTTIDERGRPHSACKGLILVEESRLYLIDLYRSVTHHNLGTNPLMSVTAVDEHPYRGYCLKGRGKILPRDQIPPPLLDKWREKKTGRTASRVIKNIQDERSHAIHPEASFPEPDSLIIMEVEEVVDLSRFQKRA